MWFSKGSIGFIVENLVYAEVWELRFVAARLLAPVVGLGAAARGAGPGGGRGGRAVPTTADAGGVAGVPSVVEVTGVKRAPGAVGDVAAEGAAGWFAAPGVDVAPGTRVTTVKPMTPSPSTTASAMAAPT